MLLASPQHLPRGVTTIARLSQNSVELIAGLRVALGDV
jgi:hypothetical protein